MALKIDVVIISNAKSKLLRHMTRDCIESVNDNRCNVIVLEQQMIEYNCTTYRTEEPFNYNRECNHAMRVSSSDYVVITNNDVLFTTGWLDALFAGELTDVMSTHSPYDGRQKNIKKDTYGYEIGYHFSGWCFCISRDAWKTIGGFDEDFPFWCADNSFMEQCREHGIINIIKPKSIVHHLGSQTLRTVDNYDELTRQQIIRFNKKYNKNLFGYGQG